MAHHRWSPLRFRSRSCLCQCGMAVFLLFAGIRRDLARCRAGSRAPERQSRSFGRAARFSTSAFVWTIKEGHACGQDGILTSISDRKAASADVRVYAHPVTHRRPDAIVVNPWIMMQRRRAGASTGQCRAYGMRDAYRYDFEIAHDVRETFRCIQLAKSGRPPRPQELRLADAGSKRRFCTFTQSSVRGRQPA